MNSKFKIYLAGGMTGISENEQKNWRSKIINKSYYMFDNNIKYFDPTKFFPVDKEYSAKEEMVAMNFDLRNLKRADLVIANISTNNKSVGTNMEISAAFTMGIPIILYNPRNVEIHPWQRNMADYVFTNIEDMLYCISNYYME